MHLNQLLFLTNHENNKQEDTSSQNGIEYSHRKTNYVADGALKTYARFLVKYPFVNIIIILGISLWAAIIGFVKPLGAQKSPDFSKPTKGFEPRGSVISSRTNSIDNLEKQFTSGQLNSVPFPKSSTLKRRSVRSVFGAGCNIYGSSGLSYYVGANKIIYKTKGNLMTAANLRDICKLQNNIMRSSSYYYNYISRDAVNQPCPSFSIPNYVAAYNNRSSCSQLTDNDVTQFITLLQNCSSSYRSGLLKSCLDYSSNCVSVHFSCNSSSVAGMLYNVFHFLSDSKFSNNPAFLKSALVAEKFYTGYSITDTLYRSVYEKKLKDLDKAKSGNVQVVAFDFWYLKFNVFNTQMLAEIALIIVALVLVLFAIWIYSGSIFIGLMTFVCVILALVLAYFIYGIVFRLPFFPFLNVLTVIFLIGIGADDAFVYMGIYNDSKTIIPFQPEIDYENNLTNWTAYTLRRALLAMFVTSFTTAAAFYSSLSSSIVAVRCFSIYAGTSILVNYLLMATWFPAIVVLYDKYLVKCMHRCCPRVCPGRAESTDIRNNIAMDTGGYCSHLFAKLTSVAKMVFEKVLPYIIIKARYIFIILLLAIGIGGIIIVFVTPKLRLSSTSDFQMFSSSNPLEQYSLNYKSKFSFESSGKTWYMPIRFVFGVKAEDTRSKYNPDDKGTVILRPTFDMVSPTAQIWLYYFCFDLRNASFVDASLFGSSTCNQILNLWNVLSSSCGKRVASPCCNRTLPISSHDFNFCLRAYIELSNRRVFESVLFDRSNNTRALVVFVYSDIEYSDAYDHNHKMFNEVESWMKARISNAPGGFKDGWWMSHLRFYDLQKSLASGTEFSLAISVVIAFGVLLLTTWNLLISLYSILSILCVISVSVGILVLSGWRLNILESIVISTAAGLSVDFTIHYGVAYRIAPNKVDQNERVRYALVHIGPAVTMGAITTFVAGLAMSPATVLAYIQLAQFLMLIMTVSWVYATFFFLPLLSVLGPKGNFSQLSPKNCKENICTRKRPNETVISET